MFKYDEFLYIDSDIIFRELPNYSLLGHHCWVSDTISYIGGEYVLSKSWKLLKNMCAIVGISPELVLLRNKHSGGAQYVMRDIDSNFWRKVEKDAINLYLYMEPYSDKKVPGGIQSWTADMWAVLWNLWLRELECKVSPELDFCWPRDPLSRWEACKILHNAGVTPKEKDNLFYKGDYINVNPVGSRFDYVDSTRCSIKYVDIIHSL